MKKVIGIHFILHGLLWGRFLVNGETPFYDTLFRLFYPNAVFFRECIHSLILPLWNPHLYSGIPFMANMQSAVFYPLTYLYAIFDFSTALVLVFWIQGVLAGVFMYLLARDLKMEFHAALLSSLLFSLNGFFIRHFAYPSHYASYIWIPLILYFVLRAIHNRSFFYSLAAGCCLAAQLFAGHPQFVFYTGIAILVLIAFHSPIQATVWPVLITAGAAFCFSAAQFIPSLSLIHTSSRVGHINFDWATVYSLKFSELLIMLGAPFWNLFFTPTSGDPHIVGFYIGLPALLLIVFGLKSAFQGKKRVLPYLVLLFVGLFLALGKYNPLYKLIYAVLVPLHLFRFPAQALYLLCLSLAVLAGFSYQTIKLPSKAKIALMIFITVDLFAFAWMSTPAIDQEFYRASTPTVESLKKDPDLFRVMASPKTRSQSTRAGATKLQAALGFHDTLFPNLAMAHGLHDVDGYEELRFDQYDDVLHELARTPLSPWMNLLNVKYLISFWKDLPNQFELRSEANVFLFENKNVLPRAYTVGQAKMVQIYKALNYVRSTPDHDYRKTVLLHEDTSNATKFQPNANFEGKIQTLHYTPNHIYIKAKSNAPGWLVVADTYAKGWTATVDGEPAPILKANVIQRAVKINQGTSEIHMKYRPPYFFFSLFLSLMAFVFFLISATWRQLQVWASQSASR